MKIINNWVFLAGEGGGGAGGGECEMHCFL